MPYTLKAHPDFAKLPPDVVDKLGCGPGEGIGDAVVPDTWRYGWPFYKPLKITPACARHDGDYRWFAESSEAGRLQADERLRKNLLRLVFNAGGPRWLIRYRARLAYDYFWFVREFGSRAFWSGERIKLCSGA